MDRYKLFLEKLHEHVQRDWDRLIPVVGDEGMGKSTLILQSIWLYEKIRGNDPTPESVLDKVVFDDRDAFREKLLAADAGDPIAVMDAAHVLYNKDVMNPDQKEVEKSLLDIRTENYVIFLGYQDYNDMPKQLKKRRAKNLVRIPGRGTLKGYNRKQLDKKYHKLDDTEWPDHALHDSFPSLEGTRLWERFDEIDKERKRSRLRTGEDSETEMTPQDIVDEIVAADSLEEYVEVNEFQDRAYYSKPLIRYDFPSLSDQEADQVRAALRREAEPASLVDDGETDTQPPAMEGKS